jgi:hypothetical protein
MPSSGLAMSGFWMRTPLDAFDLEPISGMTAIGQTDKNSVGAHIFRFAAQFGRGSTQPDCSQWTRFP